MKFCLTLLTFTIIYCIPCFSQTLKDSINSSSTKLDSTNITIDFVKIDVEAEFVGGMYEWRKFLQKNINPNLAKRYLIIPKGQNSIMQKVVAEFTVGKEGEISDIIIKNKDEVHEMLANEVIRVLKVSPNWKPGMQNGKIVKCRRIQPVWFALNDY